jgi:hypothetical protein
MNSEKFTKISLIAPCGMNCGICRAYLREKNKCPGCRGVDNNKPVSRTKCKIKNCNELKRINTKFCVTCKMFPCKLINQIDKRYRTKYNMSMIENLENIKLYGVETFIKHENIRWTCSNCGSTICVHDGCCSSCGKKKI